MTAETAGGGRPSRLLALAAGGAVLAGSAMARARRTRRLIDWSPPDGTLTDLALAARSLGSGPPTIVLLHGMIASGRYWGASFDRLGDDAELVVPDLAGFGRSVDIGEGYGPDEHADLVARAVQELAGDHPAVVGAHSLGCLVALRLAARHPDLVAGLVGFAPPLYGDAERARRFLARSGLVPRLFSVHPELADALCRWECDHHGLALGAARLLRRDLPAPLAEDRVRHTYRSFSQTLEKVVITAGAAAWLEELSVPVHLVAGDRDSILDLGFLSELAGAHELVSLSVWPGARHDVPLTHPDRCVDAVLAMAAR